MLLDAFSTLGPLGSPKGRNIRSLLAHPAALLHPDAAVLLTLPAMYLDAYFRSQPVAS